MFDVYFMIRFCAVKSIDMYLLSKIFLCGWINKSLDMFYIDFAEPNLINI